MNKRNNLSINLSFCRDYKMNPKVERNPLQMVNFFNLKKQPMLFLGLFFTLLISGASYSQTSIDVSAGLSFQDDFNTQLAIRTQLSKNLRGGIEFQYGSPKYRFVRARPIREGFSYSLSLPMSYLLVEEEKIQLFGLARIGGRFQGIIDPDGNDMRDSILTGNALIAELGLITTFKVSEKIDMQGGVSVPLAYELSPLAYTEYFWVKLHLGASLNLNKGALFLHSNIGHAFGGTGDTYKYLWSLEAGYRYSFGKVKNDNYKLINPSF